MIKLKNILKENMRRFGTKNLNEAVPEQLLAMLQYYVSADYTADQGWGESADQAEKEMEMIRAKIIKLKGAPYFDALKDFANLVTYDAEYADTEESADIQPKLEKLANTLGFNLDQLRDI
jgi:hypothetical protein